MTRRFSTFVALVAACFIVAGCGMSDEQFAKFKEQQTQLNEQIQTANDTIQALRSEGALIATQLAEAERQLASADATDEQKAEWQKQIDRLRELSGSVDSKIDKSLDFVNKATAAVNAISSRIAAAETGDQALIDGISTGLPAIAPLTGPAAPFVYLAGIIIPSILTGIATWRKGKRAGVTATAVPIETSRDKGLEAKLAAEGHNVLVVDKTSVNAKHVENGVKATISLVT